MDMTLFIKQHLDAVVIIKEIEDLVESNSIKDMGEVQSLLSSLLGKLNIHLAMEDNTIYPRAKLSNNIELQEMAVKFENEMSGLADSLKSYGAKWNSPTIGNDKHAEFILETKDIFEVFKKRISLEESEFYPLIVEYL